MQHLSRPPLQWARALLQQSDFSTAASAVKVTAVLCADAKNYLGDPFGGRRCAIHGGRGIHGSSFSLQATGRGGAGGGNDEDKDKDAEDEDADAKPRRKKGKQLKEVNPEDVANEPMDYYFSGVPPDFKAPCLSDKSKEKMWKAYQDSPGPEMIDKLAETYRIRKQRVHAILWLKDLEKEAVQRGKPLFNDIEEAFEKIHGSYDKADNERHTILPSTKPDFSVQQEGWQGSVKAADQSMDEASAKEEEMMVEEFVQRMNFNKMRSGEIFSGNSDPLIQSEVENEYGTIQAAYGEAGDRYVQWAGAMAVNLDTVVPWIMCKQPNAPGSIIDTCNSFYCDSYVPNAYDKPKMWTENWTGWFHSWGGFLSHRPVEDLAYATARFFQKGGSFVNYYMYHGGTNFGRTAGPLVTTSYDYHAPIDEYGLPRPL